MKSIQWMCTKCGQKQTRTASTGRPMAGLNKCVGCGRSITANQKYVTKHGKLFHETCLDMFLESDKGKEWEAKFLRSKAGQAEEIDEIIDLMKSYEMFTDYQEYTKIENNLKSLIAEEDDDDAYMSFTKKRNEYTEALIAFAKEKKRQEEFAHEKAQQYMNVFKQVESFIKNTTFYENDENKIKKAKESFGISNSETILFGYDDTLKNSFKSGFVLTEKKLYFTDGNSFTKNTSISVTEINSITFNKKLGIAYICINDTCISITSPIGKDSEKICELLNKAVRILQKEK